MTLYLYLCICIGICICVFAFCSHVKFQLFTICFGLFSILGSTRQISSLLPKSRCYLDINKLTVSSYPIWYLVNSVCISQAHLIIPLLLADQGGNWYCYHLGLGLLKFQISLVINEAHLIIPLCNRLVKVIPINIER